MATDKIQTGLRLEGEMLGKITYIADRNVRSFNNQIEFIIQKCIDEYEKEHGPIKIEDE